MAKTNNPRIPVFTHEGATAKHINPEQQLRRSVMACMLWEREFYEDGDSIADRIKTLIPQCKPEVVHQIAIDARNKSKLRHVPLLIAREMARLKECKKLVSNTLEAIIQRADELSEFLSLYWIDGKQPLSAQVKKGLARAFTKFDAYQLAKYNRDNAIKLRDVLFLCHAKPKDKEQEVLWKKLVDGTLEPPDTWEVSLSATDGLSKKEKWERLLKENKLGAMALLRNLRNFINEGVDEKLVIEAFESIRAAKVLPFRFIAASKYAPQWEEYIEKAMLKCLSEHEKLPGKTVILVDVSGSMFGCKVSKKSEIDRMDAACGVAMMAREICEKVDVVSFSIDAVLVPPRHGFALREAIIQYQHHDSTYLGAAIKNVENSTQGIDRIIVITDEQSHDKVPDPKTKGYMINVASYENGIGYGAWTHIDGWSESVLDYIKEIESF